MEYKDNYMNYFKNNNMKIKEINAGTNHAAILSVNGEGSDCDGSCGSGFRNVGHLSQPHKLRLSGSSNDTVINISCGSFHTILLTSPSNNIYSSGWNKGISYNLSKFHCCSKVSFDKYLYARIY